MRGKLTSFALLFAVFGAAGLTVWAVKDASASCAIFWDRFQHCVETDGNGHFEDTISTGINSVAQIPWVLRQVYTPGTSQNIETGSTSPEFTLISTNFCPNGDTPAPGCYADVPVDIAGTLVDKQQDGTFVLSAYDSTYLNCSGTNHITVKHSGTCY